MSSSSAACSSAHADEQRAHPLAADRRRRPRALPAHASYVGQKRFSLEGGEALIALLDDLVQESGRGGVEETIIGMAHRGRLNVLVNVLGKSPGELFSEFEGKYDQAHLQGLGRREVPQGLSRPTCARPAATCTWRWPSIPRTSRS
jgi:hypothetical protein